MIGATCVKRQFAHPTIQGDRKMTFSWSPSLARRTVVSCSTIAKDAIPTRCIKKKYKVCHAHLRKVYFA